MPCHGYAQCPPSSNSSIGARHSRRFRPPLNDFFADDRGQAPPVKVQQQRQRAARRGEESVDRLGRLRIQRFRGLQGLQRLLFSRARFRDADPEREHIPGAVEGVASAGLSLTDFHRFGGELRYRYFGPRPLIEDNSVRSKAASTVSARISYSVTPRVRFAVDAFNILDAKVSDVDYFYTSRLRGEPAGGLGDIHFHPLEKRSVRFAVTTTF